MSQSIPLLGRIALKLGFIDMDQLAEATRAQARAGDGKHLGKVMLELGFIDDARLQKILQTRQQVVMTYVAILEMARTGVLRITQAIEAC